MATLSSQIFAPYSTARVRSWASTLGRVTCAAVEDLRSARARKPASPPLCDANCLWASVIIFCSSELSSFANSNRRESSNNALPRRIVVRGASGLAGRRRIRGITQRGFFSGTAVLLIAIFSWEPPTRSPSSCTHPSPSPASGAFWTTILQTSRWEVSQTSMALRTIPASAWESRLSGSSVNGVRSSSIRPTVRWSTEFSAEGSRRLLTVSALQVLSVRLPRLANSPATPSRRAIIADSSGQTPGTNGRQINSHRVSVIRNSTTESLRLTDTGVSERSANSTISHGLFRFSNILLFYSRPGRSADRHDVCKTGNSPGPGLGGARQKIGTTYLWRPPVSQGTSAHYTGGQRSNAPRAERAYELTRSHPSDPRGRTRSS